MAVDRQRAAARRAKVRKTVSGARRRVTAARKGGGDGGGGGAGVGTAGKVKVKNGGGGGNGSGGGGGTRKGLPVHKLPPVGSGSGGSGGRTHPLVQRFNRAAAALAEIDLETGSGLNGEFTAEDFDRLMLQVGKAMSRAGDALGQLADRFDGELQLDRRVVEPMHEAADTLGTDVRERIRDVRTALRSRYPELEGRKKNGVRQPRNGFIPRGAA